MVDAERAYVKDVRTFLEDPAAVFTLAQIREIVNPARQPGTQGAV